MEFKLARLDSTEWVGMGAALLLAFSLLLPWYSTDANNEQSTINGLRSPDGSTAGGAWNALQTFSILDFILLAGCIAPFVLAWMVVRGHQVGWNRGEVTAIVGALVLTLILLNGIILGQPGDGPGGPVEVSLSWGYPIAIFAAAVILVTGAMRGAKGRKKQPPGV